MPSSIPPLSTLSVASLQNYDAKLQEKEAEAEAAGNFGKAQFDRDVIAENKALIQALENPQNGQEEFKTLQQKLYEDEMQLLQANPANGSDC